MQFSQRCFAANQIWQIFPNGRSMTRKNNKMATENVGCCCSKAHSKSKMSDFQVFCESTSSSSSVRRGSQLFLLLRIGKVTAVFLTVASILGNLHHVAAQNQYGGGMVDQKFAMEPQDQVQILFLCLNNKIFGPPFTRTATKVISQLLETVTNISS